MKITAVEKREISNFLVEPTVASILEKFLASREADRKSQKLPPFESNIQQNAESCLSMNYHKTETPYMYLFCYKTGFRLSAMTTNN